MPRPRKIILDVDPGVCDALAVCLALVSALTDQPLPADLVVFGEVGLAGELRQAAHAPRRLAEAARMGFRRAVVPANSPDGPPGLRLSRVATLAEAVAALAVH